MNTSEMVVRVHEIDDEILRLERERACLTAEIREENRRIIIVGAGSIGIATVKNLVDRLDALAIQDSLPQHRFLLFLNQRPDFSALVADAIKMGTLATGVLTDVKIKSRVMIANQKEARRQHELFAKRSCQVRKRARGYF